MELGSACPKKDLYKLHETRSPLDRIHHNFTPIHGDVGTAHINSGAGQSQLRRRPMLSNGRINTFPQLYINIIFYKNQVKKFCEEVVAYFRYDTDRIENDASNNPFIVAYVFFAAVKFFPSRCVTTIAVYTYRHKA
jgi:hypothetical protein